MSKKKAAGSTMTLKDFHGGSIPSDLPLPSAPGVIPNITTENRSIFDRAPWGTSVGRPDQRTRPSSSHIIRNFDDKSLFLPHTKNIGRNFNEDERKPLDGHSSTRTMVSDDVFLVANNRLQVKTHSDLSGRLGGWSAEAGPFPGEINDVTHLMAGNRDNSVSGTHPNAWTEKKEVSVANNELGKCPWTTEPAVSNLVHASAPMQVSAGRWQSKLLVPSQIGFDIVKHSEIESRGYKTNGPMVNQGGEPHGTYAEGGPVSEGGIQGGERFSCDYEKIPVPTHLDVKEANIVAKSNNKPHQNCSEVRTTGHLVQPTNPSKVVERPKLKLLPRTKPLESFEKPLNDGKPGLSAAEIFNQPIERPKLNQKPLTQRLEHPEVKTENESSAVFGGARPQERVLKGQGINDTEHRELEAPLKRMVLKPIERVPQHAIQRPMRKFNQNDELSVSGTRSETQRRNWRENDNKSHRQQQQTQEKKTRHASPETWRKPVLQKPDGTRLSHGKAASALELAQAYSPFSDPKSRTGNYSFNIRHKNQTQQLPFSRLVG